MAAAYLNKKVKYKTTIKDPGTPGTLRLTPERFLFIPHNPKSANKVDMDFKFIEGQKHTKDDPTKKKPSPAWLNLTDNQGGNYIFQFDNFSDLHDCRDFVAKVLSKSGEVSEQPTVTCADEQLSTTEMELRIKLLREDSELQKLHKQFVIGGILTEAEFWATRKKLLDREASKKAKQRVGFKSAMISDLKGSSAVSDGRQQSSSTNWKFGAEQFVKELSGGRSFFSLILLNLIDMFCLGSEKNMSTLTLDGVDVMGERLANEVLDVIQRRPNLQLTEQKIRKTDRRGLVDNLCTDRRGLKYGGYNHRTYQIMDGGLNRRP